MDSGTGQGLWMDRFVGVSQEADSESHRCGDGERRIIQFGSGGRPLIMTFMEYVIGKEENVREKRRSIVVAGEDSSVELPPAAPG